MLCARMPDTYHILVSQASHVYLSSLAHSGIYTKAKMQKVVSLWNCTEFAIALQTRLHSHIRKTNCESKWDEKLILCGSSFSGV